MVVDIGVVKNHIKPKADSTLYNMIKADLIEYIRTLEHNYNAAVSFNENQAKYIESLDLESLRPQGKWEEKEDMNVVDVYYTCSVCKEDFVTIDGVPTDNLWNYCPNCGAKMKGGADDAG